MNDNRDVKFHIEFGENGVPSFSGVADMFEERRKKERERERKADELLELQLENARLENERLKNVPTIQEQREHVLKNLLAELQTKQPDINLQSLPYSREDMFKMLESHELFYGLSVDAFEKFFKQQKLCKLRRGAHRK